jgi:hypothetical protein
MRRILLSAALITLYSWSASATAASTDTLENWSYDGLTQAVAQVIQIIFLNEHPNYTD